MSASLKLPVTIQSLPLLARAYRGAFKTGHGRTKGPISQLFSRILFYFCEVTGMGSKEPIVVRLPVRGEEKTLRLNARNRQFNALYFAQYQDGYEPLVAEIILKFLPLDGSLVDAGSNWGYFSLLVASDPGFTGRVVAFEPIPSTYRDLASVIEQAGLTPWVTTHPMALGDEAGVIRMKEFRHSGLAKVSDDPDAIEVAVATIDQFELTRVDVMKVDVEGFELAVFTGARETIKRCQPVLVFENSVESDGSHLPPLQFLEDLGYALYAPEKVSGHLRFRPLFSKERAEHPDYLNIAAVPPGKTSQVVEASIC